MEFIQIKKNPEKEVCVVKINGSYHGVLAGQNDIYLTFEGFSSPLKACNTARSLKKKYKINSYVKRFDTFKETPYKPAIVQGVCLYTQAEMISSTTVRFQEAWLIVSPSGTYVKDPVDLDKITDYVEQKELAKIYPTYEEANLRLKTLDMVVKKGHTIQKFMLKKRN
jgi:hypothetical protein